jgi:uncharacterized protein (TIGR00288 family)
VEQRNQLAVFIDFDNIEIGVKSTLNTTLDLSMVLDALKERGEVVSKSAYGDWARAGTHSRTLTDHAVHMVQRNVTPRGDKNGADINLVVDALEMCFTHPHIDGFAIVGGDSDFIALVEKLKQFGKRVYIVGGRGFTSGTMQRNCHEFISYENLLGGGRGGRGGGQNRGGGGGRMSLDKGFEKVQRALKILADKGVQPQLGPIKSTLLQLDSTFSERDFGVSSFREFIQKLADKRLLSMKRIDQGYLVESTSDSVPERAPESSSKDEAASEETPEAGKEPAATAPASAPEAPAAPASTEPIPPEEGLKLLGQAAANLAEKRSGKPVYVRHLAQELRAIVGEFDESRFGFRTLTEMAHEAQKAGLLSMQRDRVGAWRVTATSGGNATAESSEATSPAADAEKSEASSSETESKVDEAADAATNDASPAGADAEEKEAAATPARTGTKKTAAKKAAAKKTAAKKTTSKATTKKATTKKATTKKTTAKKAGTKKAATKKTTAKKAATKKADDSDS